MKKLKISTYNMVNCPKIPDWVKLSDCKSCEDCFGIIPTESVLCKRGLNKDTYLVKKERPDKGVRK